jgi:hypothetical protein
MRIERRQKHRTLHQLFWKGGVAYAFASSPYDLERIEVQVELLGAPPHHPPISLILLRPHHYSRHNRNLLLASQNNRHLLVLFVVHQHLLLHANALLAAAHLYQCEGRTLLDLHLFPQ